MKAHFLAICMILAAAPIATAPIATAADDARDLRSGFTLRLALASGWDETRVDGLASSWERSSVGLDFALGTFVNPSLEIGVQSSGSVTESRRFGLSRDVKQRAELYGLYAQSWQFAPYAFAFCVGTAVLDSDARLTSVSSGEPFLDLDYGWGVAFGARAPIHRWGRHRFEFGLEWRSMMFDHADVHQLSLSLGYQLF